MAQIILGEGKEVLNNITSSASDKTIMVLEDVSNNTSEIVNNITQKTTEQVINNTGVMWWNNWYTFLAFAMIILGLLALLGLVFYLDYRRSIDKPKEKRNIIVVVSICCIGTIFLLLIGEFMGVLPRGWNYENGKWLYPLIIFAMLGVGMYVVYKGKPKTMEDANKRVLQLAEDFFQATELYGESHSCTIKCFKKCFEQDDKGNNIPVGNFFINVRGTHVFMLIIQLSLLDLSVNYIHYQPPQEFLAKELKKSLGVVSSYFVESKDRFEKEKNTHNRDDDVGKDSY